MQTLSAFCISTPSLSGQPCLAAARFLYRPQLNLNTIWILLPAHQLSSQRHKDRYFADEIEKRKETNHEIFNGRYNLDSTPRKCKFAGLRPPFPMIRHAHTKLSSELFTYGKP